MLMANRQLGKVGDLLTPLLTRSQEKLPLRIH